MTRSTVAGSARFRQRKLSTRQTLQILREDQVDQVDDEAQRNVPKVETGVEKGEEIVSWPLLSHPVCELGLACTFPARVPADSMSTRNTIFKPPCRPPRLLPSAAKSPRYIFQPPMPIRVRSSMINSTNLLSHSRRRISDSHPL